MRSICAFSVVMFSSADGQMSGHDAATYLNHQYMAFNPLDDTSHLGLTITMQGSDAANAFKFHCAANGTQCYHGQSDCRISASLYNNKVLIDENNHFKPALRRPTGIVFNQSLVETKFGKCSYVYDGATEYRLNGGCGGNALGGSSGCGDPISAYNNLDCPGHDPWNQNACMNACRSDTKTFLDNGVTWTCAGASPTTYGVGRFSWDNLGGNLSSSAFPGDTYNKDDLYQPQVYWEGISFYAGPSAGSNYEPKDQTRDMLKERLRSQAAEPVGTGYDYKPGAWNEVVLDANLVFDVLNGDAPAQAVVAFVYDKHDPVARVNAQATANDMKRNYGLAQAVPVVAFDKTVDVTTTGPFVYEGAADTSVMV